MRPASKTPAKIKLPAGTPRSAPSRSNAGGAVRGQARAAQVHALNATRKASRGPGPTKATAAASDKRRGIVTKNGGRYFKATGQPVGGKISLPTATGAYKSAGFNPFGIPAGEVLDKIIDSKKKR